MRKILLLFLIISLHAYGQDDYYFKETFDDISKWHSEWIRVDATQGNRPWGSIDLGVDDSFGVASPSVDQDTDEELQPNNWLISPVIDLTEVDEDIILSFFIGAPDMEYYKESYSVRYKIEEIESDTAYITDFTIAQQLEARTIVEWSESYYQQRILDITALKGKKIRLAFVHTYNALQGSQNLLLLDNITIEKKSELADLAIQSITYPLTTYYPLGYSIPVSFSLINKGFQTAVNVTATYTAPGGYSFKESLPDIEAGKSYTHDFSQSLPPYSTIVFGENIRITVEASNESFVSNNSMEKTFYAVPYDLMREWTFEEEDQQKYFMQNSKIINLDNYPVVGEVAKRFPNGEAWTGVGLPTDKELNFYWGESVMASTSSFGEGYLKADRWLIFPKIYLEGTQFLLEWDTAIYSYSMLTDGETYEVLISDTGDRPEDFVLLGTYSERATPFNPSYRVLNLSEYAGKEVYIAFRNISQHSMGFDTMLWLDNIQIYSDVSSSIVEKKADNEIKFYPNPVEDILYLEAIENIQLVELINTTGQTLYQERISSSSPYELNISHLSSGIYIMKVLTENKDVISVKVIKK